MHGGVPAPGLRAFCGLPPGTHELCGQAAVGRVSPRPDMKSCRGHLNPTVAQEATKSTLRTGDHFARQTRLAGPSPTGRGATRSSIARSPRGGYMGRRWTDQR